VVAKVVRWPPVIVGTLLGVVVVRSMVRGVPLLEMVPLMVVLLTIGWKDSISDGVHPARTRGFGCSAEPRASRP
jgi:hypothetical protein